LMGVGFTLAANIPGVYLLATWFPARSGRMIGLYFMAGGLGGVFGPLVVNAIVQANGWRFNWLLMALVAGALGILSALVVRDIAPVTKREEVAAASAASAPTPSVPASAATAGVWTVFDALKTRQFAIIAITMLIIQTVVTTIHGLLVTHLADLGSSTAFGAIVMSILGFTDSIAKGAAGSIAERIGARRLFVAGIVLLCLSVALLGFAGSHTIACAFAIVFGIGWGASWLAANLLLLGYFGPHIVAPMVSAATLVTTAGIIGPIAAGMTADATGTFVPFFYLLAGLMVIAAFACAGLRPPAPARGEDDASLSLPLQDRSQ
jgi:MFS family permease